MVERYYNDKGEAAVLYSPAFGAGWSSWAEDKFQEFMLFDKGLVTLALEKAPEEVVERYLMQKFPEEHIYTGGWKDIQIEWVTKGTLVRIDEYDGNEALRFKDKEGYFAV